MTEVITAAATIQRISCLTRQKIKEQKQLINFHRKAKIKDLNERLQLQWDRLYEFYPECIGIKDINIFESLLYSGHLANKLRTNLNDSKIYVVGSDEWKELYQKAKDASL